ncbi:MAG: hypothetical protein AAGE52_24305 [Myxococcota bacterium]
MLDQLHQALAALPALLDDRTWDSLHIDYHPPRVERLFRAFGDGRVFLHRIHPCDPGEALFHPHPWPSAMAVLRGRYEMSVGAGIERATPVSRIVASAPFEYEMTDPNAWHSVRPIDAPVLSVMVTGAPWNRSSPRPERPLAPLTPDAADALRRTFGTCLSEGAPACRMEAAR